MNALGKICAEQYWWPPLQRPRGIASTYLDGHFADRQAAIVAAVARLDQEKPHLLTARQAASARLGGARHLGTTRQS